MDKLKQVGIIMGILLLADILVDLLDLSLPAPILAMLVLTGLLIVGLIGLEDVEEGANIFLGLLSFMFLPIIVAAKDSLGLLRGKFVAITIILVLGSLAVIVTSSLLAVFLNNIFNRRSRKDESKR